VWAQFFSLRMEDDYLSDASGSDLSTPSNDRLQVEVAHRAASEAAELQVDQLLGIRQIDRLTANMTRRWQLGVRRMG
jgi:hypothetical protein